MPVIKLTTEIFAPIDICFNLARSIDLHKFTMNKTNEEAIAGVTSGLIGWNETVTWRATHFGIRQQLSSQITAFEYPTHFRDEQIKGIFKSILHDHYFEQLEDKVIMTDVFNYQSPFGIFGKAFNQLILTNYLRKMLIDRNQIVKEYAESEKWKTILE